uniref:BHLH domain-containing protein n=1 Tax=Fusarium oxysporum (strain Fo5176) TaxID=660025 RepID=A0A0D2XT28_FUSOF
MAAEEVNSTLDTLVQEYDKSQFQMPPDCSSGQEPLRREMSGPLTPPEEASNPSNQQPPSKDISLYIPDVQLQLRSASRKSKNRKRRGTAPSNPEHTREIHNLVEKHYRARLKTQFKRLLTVLPVAQAHSLADRDTTANIGQVLSRGQVLDMARNHIIELEGMATMYSDVHKERDL